MADRGFSREGLFGDIHHYDQNGTKDTPYNDRRW